MEKKKSIEIVHQLERYFNATVIGSYLFVRGGLLKEEDVNDIDIAVVRKTDQLDSVKKYLEDNGFQPQDITGFDHNRYTHVTKRTKFTHPEYDKEIDLNYFDKNPKVYDTPTLIANKFSLSGKGDLEQLMKVILHKGKSDMEVFKRMYNELYDEVEDEKSEEPDTPEEPTEGKS